MLLWRLGPRLKSPLELELSAMLLCCLPLWEQSTRHPQVCRLDATQGARLAHVLGSLNRFTRVDEILTKRSTEREPIHSPAAKALSLWRSIHRAQSLLPRSSSETDGS